MKIQFIVIALLVSVTPGSFWAGDDKVEAAIGGGVGGAVGAVVGQELGDREGAIVGSAIGAAIGTAIATDDGKARWELIDSRAVHVKADVSTHGHPPSRHCPPGQAKKGHC